MRRSAWATAIVLVVAAGTANAEEPPRPPWTFAFDPGFGMEAGVRTTTGAGRMLFSYDDFIAAKVPLDESTPWGKALGVTGRLAKLYFVDRPLVDMQLLVTHEVFGHGARAQEAGLDPTYEFHLPRPYSTIFSSYEGHSGTTYGARSGSLERDIGMTIGGIESDLWGAWWVEHDMVENHGWMPYHDLGQYVAAKLTYVERLGLVLSHAPSDINEFGDPDQYVSELQTRFNRWRPADRLEIAERLRYAYLFNFVDPTFWQSLYHLAVTYLYEGKRDAKVATIPINDATFVYPGTRFNLTPFGAEHYLDVFLKSRELTFSAYGRVGSSGLADYGGGGLRAEGLSPGLGITLGAELDAWTQPELLFDQRFVFERNNQPGIGGALHFNWHLIGPVHAMGKFAAKSKGHLMGQPLDAGPYGYFGVSISPTPPTTTPLLAF